MNRRIAIFVAIAVLVAHGFALHSNNLGQLAPPYDMAYAAFNVARSLVHEGTYAWHAGAQGIDAYPSILWVWLCALGERAPASINDVAQGTGVLGGVGIIVLASRFHRDRIASLIAPLLLAVSGCLAAAIVSGTEVALMALFVLAAFFYYERSSKTGVGITLLLCGLTGEEGWFYGLGLLALHVLDSRKLIGQADDRVRKPLPLSAFGLPLLGFLLVSLYRWQQTGSPLSPVTSALLDGNGVRLEQGLVALGEFFLVTGSPVLVVFSLWYLLRRRLTGTGVRALALLLYMSLITVLLGAGSGPFFAGFVPLLPIVLIAAQEGMICALNSWRRSVRAVAWVGFVGAILLSALASRRPRDLGPFPTGEWQASWMQSSLEPRYGYLDPLGRAGVDEELARTAVLRGIGLYFRDRLDGKRTILSPWPGSISYLSQLPVYDLQGRTTAIGGHARLRSWTGRQKVDVLKSLELRADYIVPVAGGSIREFSFDSVATRWVEGLEGSPPDPERIRAVRAALEDYELMAAPVGVRIGQVQRPPLPILRAKRLQQRPVLEAQLEEGVLSVHLRHAGAQQIADLRVVRTDADGTQWQADPLGGWRDSPQIFARVNLLLDATGERSVELYRMDLGAEAPIESLRIALVNPQIPRDQDCSLASDELVLRP